MIPFFLPTWVRTHLYANKLYEELEPSEKEELKERLAKFNSESPEVSVVMPAWNEQHTIFKSLSSLAASSSKRAIEIVVINNNSKDGTQAVLDELGVRNYFQDLQGTPHARGMGLEMARGKYFLCADADTLYPPDWVDLMVEPLEKSDINTCVYGTYSFIPPEEKSRFSFVLYEIFVWFNIWLRKRRKEFMNVYGFNMALRKKQGVEAGSFQVSTGNRVYSNAQGSDFKNEAEDGRMALNLSAFGRLYWQQNPKARVFTSSRRLMDEGSLFKAFLMRWKRTLSKEFD
ncbi:glycosyltransferase family 2 protein [Marinilongibacter aquaticus]|uniref:glycosyltransferase family 2 protein n=1 Tax=Marinilongibacter aquaticus TaxID=2975157 RepID=UPI0021BD78F5|nr:glycosyltransferase family A protein [Marinilongibacter aquaticus]UBM60723.1 glycosyltransferase family 2 protein [Marinilongibacter aquaticus]